MSTEELQEPQERRARMAMVAADHLGMCLPDHTWSDPDADDRQECLWCFRTRRAVVAGRGKGEAKL